jgi:transcriptional regulator with XRE-family HTH domain
MKPLEYDYKVIRTVKALRELRQIKQLVLADALGLERSTYSRIENGELPITFGQLKIIAKELNTSVFQIMAIADADDDIDFNLTSLSDILVRFVLMSDTKGPRVTFAEEELEFIITKIKGFYSKNLEKGD